MKHRYLFLLAAPAMAGLLFTSVACDEDDDVGATGTGAGTDTTVQRTQPATPESGTPDTDAGVTAGGRMGEGEVSDQQLQQVTQRITQLRDRVQEAGDASPQITAFSQGLDSLRTAVESKQWERVIQVVGELRTAQVPEQYRQDFDAIITQLRQLNVPALQSLGEELPTVPGMPAPGGTGGEQSPPAGDRPGGGA